MRGLPKILPQFPKQVLERKVLPALLEEMKDKDLLAPILADIFAAVKIMPNGKRAFTDQVVPKLREVFVMGKGSADQQQRDTSKEAGLMVLLENMPTAAECCAGKEFHDDILPILLLALESPTHAMVDAALGTLKCVLAVLDFSTIKNELFPVIAGVFAKTSSLNIKVRGLEAFYILCGGEEAAGDANGGDLNGFATENKKSSSSNSAILDKFTMQEKVVPLLKGIKTKEPGVMMSALRVFRQIGDVVDTDYLAMEILPVLWSMSLGPLLNLQQFQGFMTLIKRLGERIEKEQTRKLRELGSGGDGGSGVAARQGGRKGVSNGINGEETDFESLVSGRKANGGMRGDDLMNEWGVASPITTSSRPSTGSASRTQSARNLNDNSTTFAWQTQPMSPQKSSTPQPQSSMASALRPIQQPITRAITPDQPLSSFAALQPSSHQFSQPLQPNQPSSSMGSIPLRPSSSSQQQAPTSIDWSAASKGATANPWSTQQANGFGFGATAKIGGQGSFGISPPPMSPQTMGAQGAMQPLKPTGGTQAMQQSSSGGTTAQKSGLDRYESLL